MFNKIKIIPEQNKKYFTGYPNNVCVVGVQVDDKKNFMPAAWNVGLSYNPFLYGVSVGTDRHTHELLNQADCFTVNFFDFKHVSTIRSLGRSSGSEIDKEKEFNLPISKSDKKNK